MSTTPTQFDHDAAVIAAYALGEADAATSQQAEALLASNPEYQALLRSYRSVAGALPLAAPAAEPAPDLRNRLLARVAAEAEGKPLPVAATPRRRWKLVRWQQALLALNLAVLLGLGGWNWNIQQQQQAEAAKFQRTWNNMVAAMSVPGVRQFPLLSDTSGTTAAFLFAPQQKLGCLVARGLPQLPANQVYQVWLERNGQLASAGTFRPNPDGNGWLVVNNAMPISDFNAIRVTVEASSGSTAPSNQRVISGGLG